MRLSVVIPCYNASAFVEEAVRSAQAQTRKADEIIVVDNASTDDTVERAARCGAGVRVIRNATNLGPAANVNVGVRSSTGDAIALLHADDVWLPEHLSTLEALLSHHADALFVFTRVRMFGARDETWPSDAAWGCDAPMDMTIRMLRNNVALPSAFAVRRSAHDAVGGVDETPKRPAHDYDYALRLAAHGKGVRSADVTVRYRVHPGQISTALTPQLLDAFRYRLEFLDRLAGSRMDEARNAVRMSWEEHLERCWIQRDVRQLRAMVSFGRQSPLLSAAARAYAMRSRCPRWILAAHDGLRRPARAS